MTTAPPRPLLPDAEFDLVLVGGGLQNALIALAVLQARPLSSLALLEASDRVGGNHTWSFHAGDVPERARALVEPLVAHGWSGYDVAFPGVERRIDEPYSAISSERLAAFVTARLAATPNALLLTEARAASVEARSVTLTDGRRIAGKVVIDARGPSRFEPSLAAGYQKFVGLELDLLRPHGTAVPTLMDARVPQTDGFRFFYVLPLAERRVLVEDTYFSDTPDLDRDGLRREILRYAAKKDLAVTRIVREESGALPLPMRWAGAPEARSPLVAGYAGGWFHPATGYSLPAALRLALHVAETPIETLFGARFTDLVREHRKQFRFAAFLNRLLFTAFEPSARWNALERFYRMPEDTIRRFYAMNTTPGDRMRLLCGRPPRGLSLRTVRATLSRGAFA